MDKLLTTSEAGVILGVTAGRVRQLIIEGLLTATKVDEIRGPVMMLRKSDVAALKSRRELAKTA